MGDLRLFAAWFAKTNGEEMSPQAITSLDVRECRQHLLTVRRHKPATVNRKLASLSAFCTWAREAGIIESDPAEGIQGVGQVEVGPRWLDHKA
jgi:integrase/recombinase XerC